MATKITPKMLEGKQLCEDNVKKFKRLYPNGLYVTEKNCLMVLVNGHFDSFDLSCLADAFLNYHEAETLEDGICWNNARFAKEFVKYWNRYRARLKKKKRGK